jgi:hypothetical protein
MKWPTTTTVPIHHRYTRTRYESDVEEGMLLDVEPVVEPGEADVGSTWGFEQEPDPAYSFFGLFLLPFGLPRRLIVCIHAGDLPRRLLEPLAIRSSTRIACSTPSRSSRSSLNILSIFIESIIARWYARTDRGLRYGV